MYIIIYFLGILYMGTYTNSCVYCALFVKKIQDFYSYAVYDIDINYRGNMNINIYLFDRVNISIEIPSEYAYIPYNENGVDNEWSEHKHNKYCMFREYSMKVEKQLSVRVIERDRVSTEHLCGYHSQR